MLIVFKTIALFFAIIVLMPILFFFLVHFVGKFFFVNVDKNSWIAKAKNKSDFF